ncbi:hypothetical protein GCM10011509_06800 [Ornithinimicrobium pekingense]|uniref:Tetratricopeptide repeat protein n=1 Tax=Ornithinimicrobium pekingense TaxID=384677 RepID=A0ABQ2F580_9MICO|nr:hypothetical protein GCM10011509_06800 [Ornithinimicrobium pekingense]
MGLALGGDREAGREALVIAWEGTRESDHAQRCVIAHYLADLQASLEDEVLWDEVALAEHAHVADADLTPVGVSAAASLGPSLHLNLGDGYVRQGPLREAEGELDKGLQTQHVLPADGYGDMVRGGLDRLRSRLHEATTG